MSASLKMTRVTCVAILILLALLNTGGAAGKRFTGFKYKDVRKCPRSARTANGFEFALRTKVGQGCIPLGSRQNAGLDLADWVDEYPAVFLIHNSGSDAWDPWVQASQFFLTTPEFIRYNVFAFNWNTGLFSKRRKHGEAQAKVAATDLAAFIRQLIELGRARQEDIHLIGFGLGAHLAGFAGKELRGGTPSILIGRITGLDPTGLEFDVVTAAERLNSTDAKLVDVIHTNAYDRAENDRLKKAVRTLGISKQIGHVDFYVNGGMLQPGCDPISDDSHRKATEIFFHTIRQPHSLFGLLCPSYAMYRNGECGICDKNCVTMGFLIERVASPSDLRRPNGTVDRNFDASKMSGRYYAIAPAEPISMPEFDLIELNVTSDSPCVYSAMLRETDFNTRVTELPLADSHAINQTLKTVGAFGYGPMLELKLTTVPPLVPLTSVEFQTKNFFTAEVNTYLILSSPVNGYYMKLVNRRY